tara:strand:- start:1122 stop:1232 length:111 start_codon:yes stop_codon:yes gene_type:complete
LQVIGRKEILPYFSHAKGTKKIEQDEFWKKICDILK